MTPEKLKRMMDACYQAKRIRDLLPTLPEGVTPSYIHFLDILQTLAKQNEPVKVSDLSDALKLPRPDVSRTVKDMVAGGYLQKIASEEDGRVTFLQITEKGQALSEKYDRWFFATLSGYLEDIPDADADCMIRTIERVYQVMSKRRILIDEQ